MQDDWPTDHQIGEIHRTHEGTPQTNVPMLSFLGTNEPPISHHRAFALEATSRPSISTKSRDWISQEFIATFTLTLFQVSHCIQH